MKIKVFEKILYKTIFACILNLPFAIRKVETEKSNACNMVAMACMPQNAKPFFWNIFNIQGKKHNQDDGDRDIDDQSIEIDENAEENKLMKWTTNDWILNNNYSMDLHYPITEDGYNLTLQRMPQPGQRPILLIHGLLTSSLAWVIMGPSKSLAFQLFNSKNYDVWLANMRGSSQSRQHLHFSSNSSDFWSFSYHEWGRYDLPAIVDHIRNETSFEQVLLIAHSQALNAILVMCALLPQYNERISFVQALAPTTGLKNHIKFKPEDVRKIMKFVKSKANKDQYEFLAKEFVRKKCLMSSERKECHKWFQLVAGVGQHEKSLNKLLYGQLLQGGSLKEIRHLQQLWKSGDFVNYDYEVEGNLKHYGTVEPFGYDLQQFSVPIVLYFGETDALATPAGVHYTYSKMLSTVKGVYRITADKFNHFDFFLSPNITILVNDRLLDVMDKFFKNNLNYTIE